MSWYLSGSEMKVKVAEWCWKKWNEHILMHINDKKREFFCQVSFPPFCCQKQVETEGGYAHIISHIGPGTPSCLGSSAMSSIYWLCQIALKHNLVLFIWWIIVIPGNEVKLQFDHRSTVNLDWNIIWQVLGLTSLPGLSHDSHPLSLVVKPSISIYID